MERLHLEGWVIGLGVLLAGTLFFGLVLLGTEISRLRQQQVDGVRLRDLIEQQKIAEEIVMASRRLGELIREDSEHLKALTFRMETLWQHGEDDRRNTTE